MSTDAVAAAAIDHRAAREEKGIGRNLAAFCLSRAAVSAGDLSYQMSLNWWLLAQTKDIFYLTAVNVTALIPRLAFSPLAGAVSDLLGGRRTLLAANWVSSLCMLSILLLIEFKVALAPGAFWLLLLLVAVQSMTSTLARPSEMVLISSTFGRTGRAVSLLRFSTDGVGVLTPPICGLLLARFSVTLSLVVCALAYLVGWAGLLLTRERPTERPPSERGLWRSLRGVTALFRPDVRFLCLIVLLIDCGMSAMAFLLTPYAKDHLRTSGAGFGVMLSAVTAGSLLATGLYGLGCHKFSERRLFAGGLILTGASYIALGFSRHLWLSCAALVALGAASAVGSLYVQTFFLRVIPGESVGSFFGAFKSLGQAIRPLSLSMFAFLYNFSGVAVAFCLSGALILMLSSIWIIPEYLDRRATGARRGSGNDKWTDP